MKIRGVSCASDCNSVIRLILWIMIKINFSSQYTYLKPNVGLVNFDWKTPLRQCMQSCEAYPNLSKLAAVCKTYSVESWTRIQFIIVWISLQCSASMPKMRLWNEVFLWSIGWRRKLATVCKREFWTSCCVCVFLQAVTRRLTIRARSITTCRGMCTALARKN